MSIKNRGMHAFYGCFSSVLCMYELSLMIVYIFVFFKLLNLKLWVIIYDGQ